MLHPFISCPQPNRRRIHTLLVSTAMHAALLGVAAIPLRTAHLATMPRAVGDTIQYITFSTGPSHLDRAAPAPRRRSRPASGPPVLGSFEFSFVSDVAIPALELPEPDVPRTADSLWGDTPGSSSFSAATITPADSGSGIGGGLDAEAYIAADVDKGVEALGANPKPAYPAEMLRRLVEAKFSVYFVVDTTGRIDSTSIQIPPSVDRRFAKAVLDVLVLWHFVPAEIRGRRVRQMLEQPFEFRIVSGQLT